MQNLTDRPRKVSPTQVIAKAMGIAQGFFTGAIALFVFAYYYAVGTFLYWPSVYFALVLLATGTVISLLIIGYYIRCAWLSFGPKSRRNSKADH